LRKSQKIGEGEWDFYFSDNLEGDFAELIGNDPAALHIIDYLEVKGDQQLYELPKTLAAIHDTLKDGVCVCALQRNPNASHPFGGYQTLAKPTVACSIRWDDEMQVNRMRVEKAKNYHDVNPNGFEIPFKIFHGIDLEPFGGWEYREKEE
jgi:hypothetical protein